MRDRLENLKQACRERNIEKLTEQAKAEMMEKEIPETPDAWVTQTGPKLKICINLSEFFKKIEPGVETVTLYWKNSGWKRKYTATGKAFLDPIDGADGKLDVNVKEIIEHAFLYDGEIKPRFWFRTNIFYETKINKINYWRPSKNKTLYMV